MKKSYSRHPLMQIIAGVAATSMISLSIAQPLLALDSMDGHGLYGDAKVYGLSFTGDFNFNKLSVNSFASAPMTGATGNYNDGGIISYSNGMVRTDLPLLTYGDAVQYPGILYNNDGEQFFNHVAAASEGNIESQAVIWPYIVGGVVVVGGIAALLVSSSSSDDDKTPVTPTAAPKTTTSTSSGTSTSSPTPAAATPSDDVPVI